MSNEMKVRFWGVRGSYPMPGAGTVKFGGNTACVEVRAGERTIILDAGTGIIPLGHELARTKRTDELLLLFSHLHHDHIQGFPYFVPAYTPNVRLHILGPDGTHESMKKVLEQNQSSEKFPVSLRDMSSAKDIQAVREPQVIVWDGDGVRVAESAVGAGEEAVVIRIHKSYAHPGGVFAYRITHCGRSVVYATDTEGYIGTDKRLVKFAKNAEVLIHDAQYLDEHYRGQLEGHPATQGYGHSTATMACEVAASAQTGQLVLFHHDPSYPDDVLAGMEMRAKSLFAASTMAYEGLEIALGEENMSVQLQAPTIPGREVQYAQNV